MKVKAFAMMAAVAGFTILPSVKADDWNKETTVTLNTSVAVPGRVLAPGQYIFKLDDNQSDRNIVQIFDKNDSRLITTLLAAPAQRAETTTDAQITLEEQSNGSPESIGKWFFAGEQDGVEFLYLGSHR